jgi:8-oxo-dGTP pyrophosphatase MutT (NUDIX family)
LPEDSAAARFLLWDRRSLDARIFTPILEPEKRMPEEDKKEGKQLPTPASTVVMLRPSDGVPFEVFMVKRHSTSRFMANAYVYPGGRLDDEDSDEMLLRHCHGVLGEEAAERFALPENEALALYVAAIREVFEESGALFATENDDSAISFADAAELDRYETYREALQDEEVSFHQIVGWEDLILTCGELVYFAHWITPPMEKYRYDTRFFLARAPSGQNLTHDNKEVTDSLWITPAAALATYNGQDFQLAPPTLHTLEALAKFHSIDEALEYYRDRPIPTVKPHLIMDEGNATLLLPGDPEYPHEVDRRVEGGTRVVMANGRWWILSGDGPDEPLH